jgi:hypothetical protein
MNGPAQHAALPPGSIQQQPHKLGKGEPAAATLDPTSLQQQQKLSSQQNPGSRPSSPLALAHSNAQEAAVVPPSQYDTVELRPTGRRVPLLAVVIMSAAMALMSTLGVLPYIFCQKLSKPWAGIANAVASGVMLAASFGLLAEGAPHGGGCLVVGMLMGVLFVKVCQEHMEQ